MIDVLAGDCLEHMDRLCDEGVRFSACVTDPPYHLTSIGERFGGKNAAPAKYGTDGAFARMSKGFMGQTWDGGNIAADPETWRAVYDCMLPGAHLVAFGGTRTSHRMACAIEDAGFEIRDTLMWLYGTGFPKSHDVSKGIDKAAGAERAVTRAGTKQTNGYGGDWDTNSSQDRERRDIPATPEAAQWAGWGIALKPAVEPIILARKPLIGTVVDNVLAYGTGALNIDAGRVNYAGQADEVESKTKNQHGNFGNGKRSNSIYGTDNNDRRNYDAPGRWPANLIHDNSPEVLEAFAKFGEGRDRGNKGPSISHHLAKEGHVYSGTWGKTDCGAKYASDSGSAARFFKACEPTPDELRFHYSGKAGKKDRAGSSHPAIKPQSLMRYLIRLVTPPGGLILDPFAGSGSTGEAAAREGFDCVLIEKEPQFVADIKRRIGLMGDAA